MKKIFHLLLLTAITLQGQTTGVNKLKIASNPEKTTAPRVLVQETNGDVGYVAKSTLQTDISGKENTIAPGTTFQYFRGDKTWQEFPTPDLSNYVDKTTVDQTITSPKIFDNNSSNTAIQINNNYTWGGVAQKIYNNGNGYGQVIYNTGTSGKGLTIIGTTTTTGDAFDYLYDGNKVSFLDYLGNLTATSFIKSGGTSSQYLMADGSVSTGNSGIGGTQYSYVAGKGTPTENATELQTAYTSAKAISGLSATNRFKIIIGAGKYEFTGQFAIDAQYIDFVSLTGDADVELTKGINVTANNVYLKGLKTPAIFQLDNNLNLLVCENCVAGNYSFGSGPNSIASGTFKNCVAGSNSFSGGTDTSIASGTFTNCVAGSNSFGKGTASGTFTNCVGGILSFGSTASGTFTNCVGGSNSFGSSTASGTFTNCVGGSNSFGGTSVISGKLFYCRLTFGTFTTVSSGGRTYYCIDGNGNTNNQ